MGILQQQSLKNTQVIGLESVQSTEGARDEKIPVAAALVTSIHGWRAARAQSNPLIVIAEFSGPSLKWIHVAESEFERRRLNLDNYIVRVLEHDDSIVEAASAGCR